ncbi:MAG: hypothetical protein KGQ37_03715 [Hyphomicrobiales bacterium]|nr:hypothetical protein [Hyphomicrobiales bacterium]
MPTLGQETVAGALGQVDRALHRHRQGSDPAVGAARTVGDTSLDPGVWTPDAYGMPPDCPVQVLGMDGDILYMVDALGQLAAIEPGQMGQKFIQRLFGARQNYLYWAWPRRDKSGEVVSWRAEKASECFYHAAGKKNLFSPLDHVRGRGAWAGRRGRLIYHSGDVLWISDERDRKGNPRPHDVGALEGDLYPRRPPILAPWPGPVTTQNNPAREMLRQLKSWQWARQQVDPVLMLGWIAASFVGGALPYRPTVFLVGDFQTGKSSLQKWVKAVFGDALLQADDTTAAGIYSAIRQDSLPVAVDEIEAEADNRKTMQVVKLARLAYSGGRLMRGSQDQSNNQFQLRSTFLFSAINAPPLLPQDMSRMAVLKLSKFDARLSGASVPVVDPETWGPMILRRMMDEWQRFAAAYAEYRDALREGGHDGRGQDTFAALLACADLLLGPEILEEFGLPVEGLGQWSELLSTTSMLEYEDRAANWRGCVNFLMTARVEAWRAGQQHTVGALLDELRAAQFGQDFPGDLARTRRMLQQADLGLVLPPDGGPWVLAVPNESQLLAGLLRDSVWAGAPGASVWKSALRQAPAHVINTSAGNNRVRINGIQRRCSLINLDALETA